MTYSADNDPHNTMLNDLAFDQQHIWHPYSAIGGQQPIYHVERADGCTLTLKTGEQLIDGMASWWSAIHGYNHPALNAALAQQSSKMAHVMFGSLTHDAAINLCRKLVDITPKGLETVFLSDSGSIAVEVAMKMALQYWHSRQQPQKSQFISLYRGYHGDTFGAMSVCDPINGMHTLFNNTLPKQHFIPSPTTPFGQACTDDELAPLREQLEQHHAHIAAFILEPIVQNAGGIHMFSADYVRRAKTLCEQYNVLLIADEIATGFGRTGSLFACEHANITPDILCLGKALTGGYITLGATLTTSHVAHTIQQGEPGVFMHGPTFMGNPLACAVALASINTLLSEDYTNKIKKIESKLKQSLKPCSTLTNVKDVRVLGAIAAVELNQSIDLNWALPELVKRGAWIRPFRNLLYLMPPYTISGQEINILSQAIYDVAKALAKRN